MRRKVILSLLLCCSGLLTSAEPQQASPSTTARPALENPAYDPTMYQQFVPQDAVQKYVHAYSGHNYQNAQGGFVPYEPAAYATIPSSQPFQAYLVPATPVEKSTLSNSVRMPTARTLLGILGQLVSLVFGSVGAVALGTLLTSILCFVTPFCTLSFRSAKGLDSAVRVGETTKEVISALGEQVTADRVKRAADFVKVAIDKFQHLNKQVREATERKAGGFEGNV
ncbi:uncharacterized protein LOC110674691 [Aedes aegypti]|uniref:Uncharacterized protein n=1 Tax=Aedes aegypti TaxID=7159 RepID=A0A6I8U1K6_AEDAE|nr:uncharacterized protein LOC110674691 [Aedes aegypti]